MLFAVLCLFLDLSTALISRERGKEGLVGTLYVGRLGRWAEASGNGTWESFLQQAGGCVLYLHGLSSISRIRHSNNDRLPLSVMRSYLNRVKYSFVVTLMHERLASTA